MQKLLNALSLPYVTLFCQHPNVLKKFLLHAVSPGWWPPDSASIFEIGNTKPWARVSSPTGGVVLRSISRKLQYVTTSLMITGRTTMGMGIKITRAMAGQFMMSLGMTQCWRRGWGTMWVKMRKRIWVRLRPAVFNSSAGRRRSAWLHVVPRYMD